MAVIGFRSGQKLDLVIFFNYCQMHQKTSCKILLYDFVIYLTGYNLRYRHLVNFPFQSSVAQFQPRLAIYSYLDLFYMLN